MEKININGETVHLKKGNLGYRVIYPHKNDDGTINWINTLIGGWENFIKLLFILFVLLSLFYGIIEMNRDCINMAENPCEYTDLNCGAKKAWNSDFNFVGDIYEEKGS